MVGSQNIYALITPLALFFILLEIGLCYIYKRKYITFQEAIANFGTAMGNQTANVLVAAGVYVVYGWLWQHYRIIDHIPMTWYNFIFLLLGVDFIFYWVHRWGHHVNIMWAAHSPHHSAEEMNFFVALRASVTQRLFSFFFFWPLTLIGFHPFDIYAVTGIHLFIAFLHHTEFISKLWGWIEFIFTTPSHHRVHHGVNFKYLDKNFGEFLIVWDRIFGTYAEEEEKVVYGMYHHPGTWNPIAINFHYYKTLWRKAVAAPFFWDKIRIWFMPLTWSPRGLPPVEPIEEITVQNQHRLQTDMFPGSRLYLIVQCIFATLLMLMIIRADTSWTTAERWIGGLLLWHAIINWSGILESRSWLLVSELTRLLITTVFIIFANELWQWPMWLTLLMVFHGGCAWWSLRYFSLPKFVNS